MVKIGVLGGGQLSLMLLQIGAANGLNLKAYCQKSDDPAYYLNAENSLGQLNDPVQLQSFLDSVDFYTFESEFLDCDKLSELRGGDKKSRPSLKLMSLLQDRKSQKELLLEHKIPTLPFFHTDYSEWMLEAADKMKNQVVFKARRNSYDGYGTYICSTQKDVENFLQHNSQQQAEFIMEPKFKFKRELAITAYRSADGSKGLFPLVQWQAKDSKCHWVMGPVSSKKMPALERKILGFLEKINYVGVMAFELFESPKGIFINELAPRVHNSTHYSLDAMGYNQFLVHLKCVLGENLPKRIEALSKGFAMVNLIGSHEAEPQLDQHNDSKLYWYGKKENRPGRKMGHVNAIAKSPKLALKNALKGASLCQL